MRRFEFIAGSSAKFWMADVEGKNFVVLYGRIGTAGQRKDKAFPSEEAAGKELEKKIAEKLREGYTEVTQGAAAPAPSPSPAKTPAAPQLPPLPPRTQAVPPTPESLAGAEQALAGLGAALGQRSFIVGERARRARRALQAIAGCDPAAMEQLGQVFHDLMARVAATDLPRLSPRLAMELLMALDVTAFQRALRSWQQADQPLPQIQVLGEQAELLGDGELLLRVAALLMDRPDVGGGTEAGWARRWQAVQPHLSAYLSQKGTSLKDYLQGIDSHGDAHIARRVARMAA